MAEKVEKSYSYESYFKIILNLTIEELYKSNFVLCLPDRKIK